jgi:hypothetical protein
MIDRPPTDLAPAGVGTGWAPITVDGRHGSVTNPAQTGARKVV